MAVKASEELQILKSFVKEIEKCEPKNLGYIEDYSERNLIRDTYNSAINDVMKKLNELMEKAIDNISEDELDYIP